SHAIERLRALEEHSKTRAVAYEMLGPPRLTKLLFEAFLCSRLRPTVRALAEAQAKGLAAEAHALVQQDGALRSHILSVGIPILAPDGERLYRGSLVVVPGEPPDPLSAAAPGCIRRRIRRWWSRCVRSRPRCRRSPSSGRRSGRSAPRDCSGRVGTSWPATRTWPSSPACCTDGAFAACAWTPGSAATTCWHCSASHSACSPRTTRASGRLR